MRKKKTVCVVTGTRAEYGILRSVIREIHKSPRLRLQVVATGMHLSKAFGKTINEIKKDGFVVAAQVVMTPKNDSLEAMARSVGDGIKGIVMALKKLQPDIVVVLGDRVEALAAAIAAAYLNIILAHIHGGDSTQGGLDESARHAITKFAHLHFPATKTSAERIHKMGEENRRIFVVGAPGLDEILHAKVPPRRALLKKFHLDGTQPIALVVQHPITTDVARAQRQIVETLEALRSASLQSIIVYPNADAGGRGMIKVIESYLSRYPYLRGYQSLTREEFLGLMRVANVMVGNSSSGIIESASLKLPVVTIGIRQAGRERSTNVITVGHQRRAIARAIRKALFNAQFLVCVRRAKSPYGDGFAGKRIRKVLERVPLSQKLLQKKLTY